MSVIESTTERKTVVELLWRRRTVVAIVLAIGFLAAVLVAFASKPKYAATATILMVAEPPGDMNKQVPTTATKPVLSPDLPSIATSETVLARFRADLGSNIEYDKLRSRIKASVSTDSNIMPVSYTAANEADAVTGANDLSKEVTNYYRQIATTRFDSLIGDLEAQQRNEVSSLQKLDGELQGSAQSYPFIDVHSGQGGSDQASVYQRLIDLSAQRDIAAASVASDDGNDSIVARRTSETKALAINNVVNNDVVYRNVRAELATSVGKLAHLHAFSTDAYPGMAELQEAVGIERGEAAQARSEAASAGPETDPTYVSAMGEKTRADASLAGDKAKLAAINGEIASLEGKLSGAGVASKVSTLRRARDNAESALVNIAASLSQARNDRAEAASTGSVVVIDPARFAQKVTWTTGTFLAFGLFVLSIWLAVSAALILESLDRRFDGEESVRSVYGLPIIGAMN